jgi:hypothetical protein
MRSHPPRSYSEPIQPFPLLSVEARKHILGDPVRTRLGIGEHRIDHAAGRPLHGRSSQPPGAPQWVIAPRAGGWTETAPENDEPAYAASRWSRPEDAPVELPLQSTSKTVFVAVAVFIAFVAVGISMFFAGLSRTVVVTESPRSGQSGPARGDQVLSTTPSDGTQATPAKPSQPLAGQSPVTSPPQTR